jgi:uncharacterized membrane protein YhiD involved in acid resistance
VAASALTLFSLLVLRVIERRMSRLVFKFITITADEKIEDDKIKSILKKQGSHISKTDYEKDNSKGEITYDITISMRHHVPMKSMLDELSYISGVKRVVIRG